MPLFFPAMLLGMLVVFHRVLVIFGPSLLYLAYRDYRRRQESIPKLPEEISWPPQPPFAAFPLAPLFSWG